MEIYEQLWYIFCSEALYFVRVTWPAILVGFVVAFILQAVYIMIDTRANQSTIALSSAQEQIASAFHVTKQMGFRPVLYCDCGAILDLNIKGNGTRAMYAFKLKHADCLPFSEAS